jgi:hypothetical protein
MSQKIVLFTTVGVRASNPAQLNLVVCVVISKIDDNPRTEKENCTTGCSSRQYLHHLSHIVKSQIIFHGRNLTLTGKKLKVISINFTQMHQMLCFIDQHCFLAFGSSQA